MIVDGFGSLSRGITPNAQNDREPRRNVIGDSFGSSINSAVHDKSSEESEQAGGIESTPGSPGSGFLALTSRIDANHMPTTIGYRDALVKGLPKKLEQIVESTAQKD